MQQINIVKPIVTLQYNYAFSGDQCTMIGNIQIRIASFIDSSVICLDMSINECYHYRVQLTSETHQEGKKHVDGKTSNKNEEISMVLTSDTVVNPLAMMIKSIHTLIANIAMA